MLEHPEIGWMERTGYPSWMQETQKEDEEYDREEVLPYNHRYGNRRQLCRKPETPGKGVIGCRTVYRP